MRMGDPEWLELLDEYNAGVFRARQAHKNIRAREGYPRLDTDEPCWVCGRNRAIAKTDTCAPCAGLVTGKP